MNVVPGSAFLQTVSGSAGQKNMARPAQTANAALHAQSADGQRRADAAVQNGDPSSRATANPYGPRGQIIDILV